MYRFFNIGQTDRSMRMERAGSSKLSVDGLCITTVHDLNALRLHWEPWDRLAWEAPRTLPMQLPAWVDAGITSGTWLKERWFCSFAYAGDRLVGVLPVIVGPHPVLGRGWPVLRTFDIHSQSGDILLAPDHADTALKGLLAELRRQVPSLLGLKLKAVRQNSPFWVAIEKGLDGYAMRHGRTHPYSLLDVSGDYDAYLASLGSMRYNARRYLKKLRAQGAVSTEIMQGSSAREDFLAEFLALEASGWKGRKQWAIANRPDAAAFYTALIRNFAAEERLEWYALRVDGRLIAAGMALRCGPTLMVPKVAYDEEFSKCMPGHLLFAELIKDVFARPDIRQFEFLSSANWLQSWRVDHDTYVDVDLVPRDMLPMLLHLARGIYQDYVGRTFRPR